MLLNEFLDQKLSFTVMINLKVTANPSDSGFCYTLWNRINDQLHLLRSDYTIGHIIHQSDIVVQEDGSLLVTSKYHPENCIMYFYFGGG